MRLPGDRGGPISRSLCCPFFPSFVRVRQTVRSVRRRRSLFPKLFGATLRCHSRSSLLLTRFHSSAPKQQFVTKELLWGKMRGFCVDSCDNYVKRSFPEWHWRIGREPHISMKVDLKLVLPSVAQRSSVA